MSKGPDGVEGEFSWDLMGRGRGVGKGVGWKGRNEREWEGA